MGSKVGAYQGGKDGVGNKNTIQQLSEVRLKAKAVTSIKNTTLQITGNQSGATWTIGIQVSPGTANNKFYPPSKEENPLKPTAGFDYNLGGSGNNNNNNFNQQNPGFNAGSVPPNLDF